MCLKINLKKCAFIISNYLATNISTLQPPLSDKKKKNII